MDESLVGDENNHTRLETIVTDGIVAAVLRSRKYRAVCPDTVRRIARRELANRGDVKTAVKETKRKLHQVYGAYEEPVDYHAAHTRLAVAYETRSEAEVRAVCRGLLARHASTRERLPILDEFYPPIWAVTGRPASLLDLGCGLNPLTIPWMDLAPGTRYHAFDIDADRVAFLNRTLALAGCLRLARCQDILCQPPDAKADVALLLKTIPCLDRQEPDGARRVLTSLRTRFVVAGFAIKSLGGREKGMARNYQAQFLALAEEQSWPVTRLAFATELVFVAQLETGS
ncbi:MAG: 16S rRNA methyltransferase [Chloroflexi bacterium]|nr:16S rRNA methyltransferase [Chloroflexota bacterium]MBU1747631.1 16S rRNA methyltransferase [Chloroflexota bacterium]MBU1878643.1 16S rRNA methyltransferase [Chloroflexota bacterium]